MPVKVARWIAVVAEEIGCTCRTSRQTAELIQAAFNEQKKRGPGPETWLTPYFEIHKNAFGGYPTEQTKGVLAKACKEAEGQAREDVTDADEARRLVWLSFREYCHEMKEGGRFAFLSFPKWANMWRQYIPGIRM